MNARLSLHRAATWATAVPPSSSGASLEVLGGEVVGLVGPNGAGKSTLLRAVTSDAELLGGSIEVAGRSIVGLDARERAQLVGVVPQALTPAPASPPARS